MGKNVKIQKYIGDDYYSWAVFVNGKPKWTGLSKSEAKYYKKIEEGVQRDLQNKYLDTGRARGACHF